MVGDIGIPRKWLIALCAGAIWSYGCAAPAHWNGSIRQWGTMRTVLAEGQTQGRVSLDSFDGRRGVVAVGALVGLAGEVTILEGQVWITRVDSGEARTSRSVSAGDRATLLTLADVPKWASFVLDREVQADGFDSFVREVGERAGLDTIRPFPFVVRGDLVSLEAHVINGDCPLRARGTGESAEAAPLRFSAQRLSGTLVGFYAEGAGGELTHHGSATHVHVLLDGDRPMTAHVDSAVLPAGAIIRVPERSIE